MARSEHVEGPAMTYSLSLSLKMLSRTHKILTPIQGVLLLKETLWDISYKFPGSGKVFVIQSFTHSSKQVCFPSKVLIKCLNMFTISGVGDHSSSSGPLHVFMSRSTLTAVTEHCGWWLRRENTWNGNKVKYEMISLHNETLAHLAGTSWRESFSGMDKYLM